LPVLHDLGKKVFVLQYRTRSQEHKEFAAPKSLTLGSRLEVIQNLPRIAECPFVFFGSDLKSHLTTVRKPWVKVRKRAGLDGLDGLGGFRIHDLRRNVVSWDVSRGVPLEIAGRNVGHRSRRSTEVYAHFAPDALKRAADERAAAMRRAVESGAQRPHEHA
jgi:integrase